MPATVECHGIRTGITVTVSIYPDGNDTAASTGIAMTEATNRKGTYTFSNTTETGLHLIRVLEGTTQRWYGWAVLATDGTIIASDNRREALSIPNAAAGVTGGLATHDTANAIKAKTDNLPADPADQSAVEAAITAATSSLASQASVDTVAGYIDTEIGSIISTLSTIASYIDTEIAAIKLKTDALPADPADASDIAASFSAVTTLINTLTAYVDTEVAAIKAKTDQLVFTVANKVDATATVDVDEAAIATAVVAAIEADGITVTITSQPLTAGSEIEIVVGDDYYDADDRALTCRIAETGVGLLTDDDWQLTLNTPHADAQTVIGTATRVDDDTIDLSFDVPASKTDVLRAGVGDWCVSRTPTATTRRVTPVRGVLTVLQDLELLRHKNLD